MNAFFIASSTSQISQTGQKYSQNYAFSAISKHTGLQILRTSDGSSSCPELVMRSLLPRVIHASMGRAGDPRAFPHRMAAPTLKRKPFCEAT
jgi:hypothetical protein